eukprot:TRINITY_DN11128_c0_g1_i1.p1 TRINITY_DN11128_c0_g1~~TRINITY_DN11128_c0_g1_i1.p1  ORF type:complete len:326 (-),score=68.30 TRINITY_DN11128_c0_g1_i1:28-1005(-)
MIVGRLRRCSRRRLSIQNGQTEQLRYASNNFKEFRRKQTVKFNAPKVLHPNDPSYKTPTGDRIESIFDTAQGMVESVNPLRHRIAGTSFSDNVAKEYWKKVKSKYEQESKTDQMGFPMPPEDIPLNLEDPKELALALNYTNSIQDTVPLKNVLQFKPTPAKFSEVVYLGRHTKITAGGRIFGYSALVLSGFGKGAIGLGYGRGPTSSIAVEFAEKDAQKKMVNLELYKGCYLGFDIRFVFKKSVIWMKQARPGYGTRAPYKWRKILDTFGLKDIIMGIEGSQNPHSVYQALIYIVKELSSSPHELADMTGRKLFRLSRPYYKYSQ